MNRILGIAALAMVAGTAPLHAQGLEGDVALSFGAAQTMSTDDSGPNGFDTGYKAAGWAGVSFGDWRVFGDVNHVRRDFGTEDFDEYAPNGADSLGVHAGRNFGSAYVGAFAGINNFQGDDAATTNGYVSGSLYGIEGQYDMGSMSVFGQFGRADMVGDGSDTLFVGNFARLGVSKSFNKLTLTADIERGRSPFTFEDGGDSGTYYAAGLIADYQITDRIIGTLSFTHMDINANTEDNGFDDVLEVGIRIPLGAGSGERNTLTTSYRPGLAAAWAETLD